MLGCMVRTRLVSQETSKPSSHVAAPFCIPTSYARAFLALHVLERLGSSALWIWAIFGRCVVVSWCICISPTTYDVERRFMCWLAICTSSLVRGLHKSLARFLIRLSVFFRLRPRNSAFWMTGLYPKRLSHIFSP